MPKVDFTLYLISDRRQCTGLGLLDTLAAALDGGVRAVQLREKDLPADQLLKLAEPVRRLTRTYQARLLINQHVDIALAVEADGVHLPSGSPELARARERLGPSRLLGASTHNLAEIRAVEAAGADFVTFGPVYATPSKRPYGEPLGLDALQDACRHTGLPVFALGGITLERLVELPATGVAGVALIGAIIAAAEPCQAARNILAGWPDPADQRLPQVPEPPAR